MKNIHYSVESIWFCIVHSWENENTQDNYIDKELCLVAFHLYSVQIVCNSYVCAFRVYNVMETI